MIRYLNGNMGKVRAHGHGYSEVRREASPNVEYTWPSR